MCTCGHVDSLHRHLRVGSDCGACSCKAFRQIPQRRSGGLQIVITFIAACITGYTAAADYDVRWVVFWAMITLSAQIEVLAKQMKL